MSADGGRRLAVIVTAAAFALPALAWAGVIFFLSSRSAADYEGKSGFLSGIPGLDLIVHGVLYFVLAAGVMLWLRVVGRASYAVAVAAAVAIAVAYGVTDEYHQTFVEGRYADPLDVVADGLGALTAVALWPAGEWLWARRGQLLNNLRQ